MRPELGLSTAARWRLGRRIAAVTLALAVGIGAIVAPGFDVREVHADDPAVWVLQSADGQRFGRVNTEIGEVDTVKAVGSPSDIVQHGNTLLVYANNLGTVTTLSTGRARDIADAGDEATKPTPPGTAQVDHAGDVVAYRTETGGVLAGRISDGTATTPGSLDPFAHVAVAEGEDRPQFRADAVAAGADGTVVAYSAELGQVMRARVDSGEVDGLDDVVNPPDAGEAQLAAVGATWVLFDGATGRLWHRGGGAPIETGTSSGARLQRSSDGGSVVYLADQFGVVAVDLSGGSAVRAYGSTDLALGDPAAPTWSAGVVVAAWLPQGAGPGTMWTSANAVTPLDFGGGVLGDVRSPELRSNGSRLTLNEGRTGWAWTVPSGTLVRSSQVWNTEEAAQVAAQEQETAKRVDDPRAPIAEDDALGVRPGRQVVLPVLLNDHDANRDILTIVPGLVSGLDPAFGTVAVADDDQTLVVSVAPGASGVAAFTYQVSDGTSSDGLLSAPATVTLSVKSADQNSPPVWCGVDDCLVEWPTPQVSPGGTVSVDALSGWVDPEGDPIYIKDVTTASTVGVVAGSPEGQVVFHHTNANSTDAGTVPVVVTVSDARGASAEKEMAIAVLAEPTLTVKSLAVTVTAGTRISVPVADHVTGATGPLQVSEASIDTDAASVEVPQGFVGFVFDSDVPGAYLVSYTVTDGSSDVRATARVTVISPDDEKLTTVPLTAFVRAREDVTVDVLAAITNPGGHVLLLSDVQANPESGATLSVDVVGHSVLRLSGTTADAQPGSLGVVSYLASDGSGRPGAVVRGEVTVMLLDSDTPSAPLAVDDAITVRVGTQADIKVLANDIAPAGHVIALDAGSVVADASTGLAFPAGSVIRYLAPMTPGVYSVDYSAYVLGYPGQRGTATVVVTVLANSTNAAPTPPDLYGRVASGESVRIPFDGTGIDPDGDTVTLKNVETQPQTGSATIAADGAALIFRSNAGFSGQVTFTYSVVDARGQSATATVHVGVLAQDLDPSPVTYTDYVQVQAGAGRKVVVTPTANDLDLSGGTLELVEVVPDARLGTDEFRELSQHLVSVEGDVVTMEVGADPGTFSYLYTVRNAGGSTAIGRIILKSVREPVSDPPLLTDTVLTPENRDSFVTGVDVLTGKVAWGSGDPQSLVLSLWGDPTDLVVKGSRISGPLPALARLVPFVVTGTNFNGESVTSYGFLRIPGIEDYRLTLKASFAPPQVDEEGSITFDLSSLVVLPDGASVVIDPQSVRAGGDHPDASCELVSGTSLRYNAGKGAPFADICVVSARLASQETWTLLSIPVVIIAAAPQPTLTRASIALSPGATVEFDLSKMVSWPAGATPRAVTFASTYSGEQFVVARDGSKVTVTAKDRAVPGRVEGVTISLDSDRETPAVSLSLEVGPAPSELPKGATVVQQCSEANGASCTITVVGKPGEVNPLPGTPLEVVSVEVSGDCPGVTFAVGSSSAVTASWQADAHGGVCAATFAVRDAQGRVSGADGIGTISLDLQGYPAAPAEIRQTNFADGSVTLAVSPGAASGSYPGPTGFAIYAGAAKVATCTPAGACAPVSGLTNGAKVSYSARTVSAVGESKSGPSVVAWAYAPPAPVTSLAFTPTKTADGQGKQVDLTFDVSDPNTAQVVVTSPTGTSRTIDIASTGTKTVPGYVLDSNQPQPVSVTSVSTIEIPPGAAGNAAARVATIQANGVGKPVLGTATVRPLDDGNTSITVPVVSGGSGSETWAGILLGGSCTPTVLVAAGAPATFSVTPTENRRNTYTVCAESRFAGEVYGTASPGTVVVKPFRDPGTPAIVSGYAISSDCQGNGTTCQTTLIQPTFARDLTGTNIILQYVVDGGGPVFPLALSLGLPQTVIAYYCVDFGQGQYTCSSSQVTVPVRAGSPRYPTSVTFSSCAQGTVPPISVAALDGDWSVVYSLTDIDGAATADFGAMATASATVTFGGNLAGIAPWTSDVLGCSGVVYPDPDPDPSPSPDPLPDPSPAPSPDPLPDPSPAP